MPASRHDDIKLPRLVRYIQASSKYTRKKKHFYSFQTVSIICVLIILVSSSRTSIVMKLKSSSPSSSSSSSSSSSPSASTCQHSLHHHLIIIWLLVELQPELNNKKIDHRRSQVLPSSSSLWSSSSSSLWLSSLSMFPGCHHHHFCQNQNQQNPTFPRFNLCSFPGVSWSFINCQRIIFNCSSRQCWGFSSNNLSIPN